MQTFTQKLEDFQTLLKPANDAKKQFCKICKQTSKRYDAKNLGYSVSFVYGGLKYDEKLVARAVFGMMLLLLIRVGVKK